MLFEQSVALLLSCLVEDSDDKYEKPFTLPLIHMLAIQNHRCCIALSALLFLPWISGIPLHETYLVFSVIMVTYGEVV